MLARTILVIAVITAIVTGLLALAAMTRADEPGSSKPAPPAPAPAPTPPAPAPKADPADVLGFTMNRIDGTSEDLSIYRGKVVMIVNVASKCGLTKQYAGLQTLYESKKDQGLVILGFPANDFLGQEPGTNTQIKEFCEGTYKVTFPMFEKIVVTGKDAHPLYKKLAAQPAPIGGGEGVPGWNFTKFIVDRSGRVVARFDSRVKPDDAALVKKIDELLASKKD